MYVDNILWRDWAQCEEEVITVHSGGGDPDSFVDSGSCPHHHCWKKLTSLTASDFHELTNGQAG